MSSVSPLDPRLLCLQSRIHPSSAEKETIGLRRDTLRRVAFGATWFPVQENPGRQMILQRFFCILPSDG